MYNAKCESRTIISREFFYRKDLWRPQLCPCVDISISPTGSLETKTERFLVRLDTGADISMIPEKYVKPFLPLHRLRYFDWTDANGRDRTQLSWRLWISIYDRTEYQWTVFPPDGVLLTETERGFLGMDVLQYFDIAFYGDLAKFDMKRASPAFRFEAERKRNGGIIDD